MATPPEPPASDGQSAAGPPPGWVPPAGQSPAGPPPGWTPPVAGLGPPVYPPPPPVGSLGQPRKSGLAGAIWAGVGAIFVDILLSLTVVLASSGESTSAAGAWIFAGIVFLGGGGLCFVESRPARGFAIGLMVGWALLTITTAGVCTGLTNFNVG